MESMAAEVSGPCSDEARPYFVTEQGGLQFGSTPHSHVTFTVANYELAKDFVVSFAFRSSHPRNGLFLLVKGHTKKYKTHLAVMLQDGKILLDLKEMKNVRLTTGRTLDDGKWHNVSIIKKSKTISLKVDKESAVHVATRRRLAFRNPIFVGGLPNDMNAIKGDIVSASFNGCVRSFYVNGQFVDLAGGMRHNVSECVTRTTRRGCA